MYKIKRANNGEWAVHLTKTNAIMFVGTKEECVVRKEQLEKLF